MISRIACVAAAIATLIACGGPSQTTGDGGDAGGEGGDAGKPNPCEGKMNYVFDDTGALPNGFTVKTCAAFAAAEKAMTITTSASAAQFSMPQAGVKIPVSKPFKFSWSQAMFPNAPMPGMDPNKVNGIGYVIVFVDANTSKELLRAHTINQEYTPDDTAWGKLKAAATMPNPPGLQLKIYSAFYVDDAIMMDSGPTTPTQPRLVFLDPMM